MNKIVLKILILFFAPPTINAQKVVAKTVLSNCGNIEINNQLTIEFTIGEIFTDQENNSEFKIYQGFHEPTNNLNTNSKNKENRDEALIIYPNPVTNDQFFIRYGKQINDAVLNIYDYGGKRILSDKITNNLLLEGYLISTNSMSSGVYVLQIINNNQNVSKKIQVIK